MGDAARALTDPRVDCVTRVLAEHGVGTESEPAEAVARNVVMIHEGILAELTERRGSEPSAASRRIWIWHAVDSSAAVRRMVPDPYARERVACAVQDAWREEIDPVRHVVSHAERTWCSSMRCQGQRVLAAPGFGLCNDCLSR